MAIPVRVKTIKMYLRVFNDTVNLVKEKVLSGNVLDKLQNFNPEEIENKVKDKLKNKLKN